MRSTYLCISIVMAVILPVPCLAQTVEGDAQSRLTAALARSARIRIRLDSGPRVEIREAQLREGVLIGRSSPGVYRSYRIEEVEQVWRRGSGAGRGLAIGGLIGFGVGAVLGVAASNICVWGDCHTSFGDQARGGLAGGLVVAAVTGTVGGLIGAATGRWQSVYAVPRAQRIAPVIGNGKLGLSFGF